MSGYVFPLRSISLATKRILVTPHLKPLTSTSIGTKLVSVNGMPPASLACTAMYLPGSWPATVCSSVSPSGTPCGSSLSLSTKSEPVVQQGGQGDGQGDGAALTVNVAPAE